jgi:transglutaminase-like putative cysteine protease
MRFHVSSHLEYTVKFPSTMIFNIHAQRNPAQTILEERFSVEPYVKVEEFLSENGENRFVRLETGESKQLVIDYAAVVDCEFEAVPAGVIDHTPVAKMDRNTIPYLFPSRYCQSDKLGRLAWDLFGKIPNAYEKVIAIVDWIHGNVEYLRGSTDSETSAYDTVVQRTGVCRDFAHLGIALCRSLNIPSRYFSGYAYLLDPPDFHACFESFVGGHWMVFDATRLAPLNGLVRIGTGSDAASAAVASIFGQVQGTAMKVDCQLVAGQDFTPLSREQQSHTGISPGAAHVATAD